MSRLWQYLTGRRRGARPQAGAKPVNKNVITCTVVLLDGTDFHTEVGRRALGEELLEKVFYHLDLVEKDYFGLQFCDSANVPHWLDPTKSIKRQISIGPPFTLHFRVKFYSAEPSNIKEDLTRYHMFLNLKTDISSGKLECDKETVVQLAALALQSELGDFDSDEHTVAMVSELKFCPEQSEELELEILEEFTQVSGLNPAQAELRYLNKARLLDNYGVDMHPVVAVDGKTYTLGLTPVGILIFETREDGTQDRIGLFFWPKMTSLDLNGKKLTIVVQEEEETADAAQDHTFVFRHPTQRACKHLWKCAVEFHTFYRLSRPQMMRGVKQGFIRRESRFRPSFRTEHQMRSEVKNSRRGLEFTRQPSQRFSQRPAFERAERDAAKVRERQRTRQETANRVKPTEEGHVSDASSRQVSGASVTRQPLSPIKPPPAPSRNSRTPDRASSTSPTKLSQSQTTVQRLDDLISADVPSSSTTRVATSMSPSGPPAISLLEASERAQAKLKAIDDSGKLHSNSLAEEETSPAPAITLTTANDLSPAVTKETPPAAVTPSKTNGDLPDTWKSPATSPRESSLYSPQSSNINSDDPPDSVAVSDTELLISPSPTSPPPPLPVTSPPQWPEGTDSGPQQLVDQQEARQTPPPVAPKPARNSKIPAPKTKPKPRTGHVSASALPTAPAQPLTPGHVSAQPLTPGHVSVSGIPTPGAAALPLSGTAPASAESGLKKPSAGSRIPTFGGLENDSPRPENGHTEAVEEEKKSEINTEKRSGIPQRPKRSKRGGPDV